MKKRSIPLFVLLSIISFGVFFFIWFFRITSETIDELKYRKIDSPWLNLLFLILGNVFYYTWWNYKISAYLATLESRKGIETDFWMTAVSLIYGPVLHQSRINRIVVTRTPPSRSASRPSTSSAAVPRKKTSSSAGSSASNPKKTPPKSATSGSSRKKTESSADIKNALLGVKTKK